SSTLLPLRQSFASVPPDSRALMTTLRGERSPVFHRTGWEFPRAAISRMRCVRERRCLRDRGLHRRLEHEQPDALPSEEDLAEVEAGHDFADLVADHARDERRARVVDDDRGLVVEPARALVYLCADAPHTERRDEVLQILRLGPEHLA